MPPCGVASRRPTTATVFCNNAPPQVKELIEKAVGSLEGKSGSKEAIIAMAEALYPPLAHDSTMQRSLDQAFSKYLQVQPARVMLLQDDPSSQFSEMEHE